MSLRRRTSAALHLELTEYTSLLRTIRTTSTLDIVPHLSEQRIEETREEDDDLPQGPQGLESSEPDPSSKGKGKARQKSRLSSHKDKDTWTRWPLLLENCPIPDWGFDEEIKIIAEQCLREHMPVDKNDLIQATSSNELASADHEDSLDQTLSSVQLSALVSDVSTKLSTLLFLLALHRPNVTSSKHGRVNSMKWEDVLEVAGMANLFDIKVIKDAKQRMEKILGPSASQVIHYLEVLDSSKRALEAAEVEFGQDILSFASPPPRKKTRPIKSAAFDVGPNEKKIDNSASEDDEEVR